MKTSWLGELLRFFIRSRRSERVFMNSLVASRVSQSSDSEWVFIYISYLHLSGLYSVQKKQNYARNWAERTRLKWFFLFCIFLQAFPSEQFGLFELNLRLIKIQVWEIWKGFLLCGRSFTPSATGTFDMWLKRPNRGLRIGNEWVIFVPKTYLLCQW